jgi:hypothetical protein
MRTVAADTLTLRQLNRATLARQLLLTRSRIPLVDGVERLIGLQAQLARPAFVGLWSRLEGVARGEVVEALLAKRLVRGTSMRGTLHVMSAADFRRFRPPLQAALDGAARVLGSRAEGWDVEPVLALGRSFFREPRTFDAFRAHLGAAFPDGDLRAMAYTVRMQLPLVQVPTGSDWGFPAQADFVSADAWLGRTAVAPASTAQLVLRYLTAYGPATITDAQAWLGIAGLKATFEALRPQLLTFKAERGGALFDLPDAPRPAEDEPAPVRLLPEWDNVIVARADARMLAREHRPAVFRPGLRVLATVLVDGTVAGTWQIERRRKVATLSAALFTRAAARVRQEIEAEAMRLLEFVEPDASSSEVRIS